VHVEVLTKTSRLKDWTDLRHLKDLTFKDKRLVMVSHARVSWMSESHTRVFISVWCADDA
jgi:hypothetical protein